MKRDPKFIVLKAKLNFKTQWLTKSLQYLTRISNQIEIAKKLGQKIEPFTALLRGQSIVFGLSFTAITSIGSFTIFLPLVAALDPPLRKAYKIHMLIDTKSNED